MITTRFAFGIALLTFVYGCVSQKTPKTEKQIKVLPTPTAQPTPVPTPTFLEEGFYRIPWERLQGLKDDSNLESLAACVEESLKWIESQKPEKETAFGTQKISLARIAQTLYAVQAKLAQKPSSQEFQNFLQSDFELWQSIPAAGKPLLTTGYYIPKVQGSAFQTSEFKVPVFGIPSDFVSISLGDFDEEYKGKKFRGRLKGNNFVPYFNREQIRADQNLFGRAQILTWVRSEWDAFLIEVQGSGILAEGNSEYLLSYADQNGRPYRPVGKLLLQENKVPKEKMSMQAIGKYLEQNPNELRRVLDYNPSFVFFEKTTGRAKGSLGFPLTAGRSVAVDYSRFPQGALGFVDTHEPTIDAKGNVTSGASLSRYVLNQDTGGAIRGQGRMDFFWGAGTEALEKAGAMQHNGKYYLILKKQ